MTVSNLITSSNGTSPGSRRREANRERILASALEIVSNSGLAGLTLAGVAAATDYTRAALYRYFDSKEALVGALSVSVINEVTARMHEALAEFGDLDALAKLVVAVISYQQFARESPEKFSLLALLLAENREILPSESTGRPAIEALERALEPIAAALAEATASGDLDPGEDNARATVLFAAVHGALTLRKQSARSSVVSAPHSLSNLALATLLRGWGAPRDALALSFGEGSE